MIDRNSEIPFKRVPHDLEPIESSAQTNDLHLADKDEIATGLRRQNMEPLVTPEENSTEFPH